VRASGYTRAASDWYVEPRWIVEAMLDVEPLSGLCWDPAAGGGTIPQAIRNRGGECLATDIKHRGHPLDQEINFLHCGHRADHIVSNPPYAILEPFVEHGLRQANGKVVVLARLAFLESQSRKHFFFRCPLARVWVSRRRASMPPGGTNVPATGGTIAYAWFVFERGHEGPWQGGWV
jgi:hypothetical protein